MFVCPCFIITRVISGFVWLATVVVLLLWLLLLCFSSFKTQFSLVHLNDWRKWQKTTNSTHHKRQKYVWFVYRRKKTSQDKKQANKTKAKVHLNDCQPVWHTSAVSYDVNQSKHSEPDTPCSSLIHHYFCWGYICLYWKRVNGSYIYHLSVHPHRFYSWSILTNTNNN